MHHTRQKVLGKNILGQGKKVSSQGFQHRILRLASKRIAGNDFASSDGPGLANQDGTMITQMNAGWVSFHQTA